MQIAPGWLLFYEGRLEGTSRYLARLIGPERQVHTVTALTPDALVQQFVALLDALGIRLPLDPSMPEVA